MEKQLIVLPNKDLWRGHERKPKNTDNVVFAEGVEKPAKIDEVMASILKASAGAKELSCIYCGLQFETVGMREHLKKEHRSAIEPPTEAEILASLQQK